LLNKDIKMQRTETSFAFFILPFKRCDDKILLFSEYEMQGYSVVLVIQMMGIIKGNISIGEIRCLTLFLLHLANTYKEKEL